MSVIVKNALQYKVRLLTNIQEEEEHKYWVKLSVGSTQVPL